MSNESEWWGEESTWNQTNSTSGDDDDDYDNLRGFYFSWVTMGISTISAACNAFLLTILVTYRRFRQKHKIIVALSIADLVNSIAICIQYGHKAVLLGEIMDTGVVPTSTAAHCALNPASFMETIGALWPAIISLLVAAENLVLVNVSSGVRRRIKHRAPLLIGFSVLVVIGFMAIGTIGAFSHADREVGWWCPRHKYISNNYGEAIDITNFTGYFVALALNVIAAVILKVKEKRGLSADLHEESQKIVCHLFSTISAVVLVSVPNFALHYAPSNDMTLILEYPCAWCFAINSGLSIVVCLAFLEDFRKSMRVFRDRLLCRHTVSGHESVSRLTTTSTFTEERKKEDIKRSGRQSDPIDNPVQSTRRKSIKSIASIISDLDIRAFPILAGFTRMSEESEC
ncbi:hypothetical protein PENTCL1PPCAC_6070 [Pristionchus entomophagus]|uniref:G-protein coupled receptors family 1 profile domain-containing protein n=1 Tax=Pristionchus entomophagus TaxID=358040 RepID=A0AAV5SV11_9BILA|nr:hypothetical protein PENTCL1PPCAC_6070 [Pristionchus entomophagus]